MERTKEAGFDDFSVSSALEEVSFSLEQHASKWITRVAATATVPGEVSKEFTCTRVSLEVVQHRLPFRKEAYVLSLHFPEPEFPSETVSLTRSDASAPAPSAEINRQPPASAGLETNDESRTSLLNELSSPTLTASNFMSGRPPTDPGRWLAAAVRNWWPHKRFSQHARYRDELHKLQRWFGVDIFMTLTPYSSSKSNPIGRSEALTLRSAACLALSEIFRRHHASGTDPVMTKTPDGGSCSSLSGLACIPIFVPMLIADVDAWLGVACVGDTQVFFETESMSAAGVRDLFGAQAMLQVFAKRLATVDDAASAVCLSLSTNAQHKATDYTVAVSSCFVYNVPAPVSAGFVQGIWPHARGAPDVWDLGAPWHPWSEQPDPVQAIHVDIVWGLVPVHELAAKKTFDAFSAHRWILTAVQSHTMQVERGPGRGGSMPAVEWERHVLQLPDPQRQAQALSDVVVQPGTFAAQLRALAQTLMHALPAHSWAEIQADDWWHEQQAERPPVPRFQALTSLARDALSGMAYHHAGLPAATSAARFMAKLADACKHRQREAPCHCVGMCALKGQAKQATDTYHATSTERSNKSRSDCTNAGSVRLLPWAAAVPCGSPLGLLSLHMLKLRCPLAIAELWSAFIGVLAVDYCETLTLPSCTDHAVDACALMQNVFNKAPSVTTTPYGDGLKAGDRNGALGAEDLVFQASFMSDWMVQLNTCIAALDSADRHAAEHGSAEGPALAAVPEEPAAVEVGLHIGHATVVALSPSDARPSRSKDMADPAPDRGGGTADAGTTRPAPAWESLPAVALEAHIRALLEALRDVAPAHVIAAALLTAAQIALVSIAACPGAALPMVRAVLNNAWQSGAKVSGKVWALLQGPSADRAAQQAEAQRKLQRVHLAPELDAIEMEEVEESLASLVASVAYAERVAATSESLHRRLPGCGKAAAAMLARAMRGPGGVREDSTEAHSTTVRMSPVSPEGIAHSYGVGSSTSSAPPSPVAASGLTSHTATEGSTAPLSGSTLVADLTARHNLAHLMQLDWSAVSMSLEAEQEGIGAVGPGVDNMSRMLQKKHQPRKSWGAPLRREAVLLCRRAECGCGDPPHEHHYVPHRLYLEHHGSRVRVALATVSST